MTLLNGVRSFLSRRRTPAEQPDEDDRPPLSLATDDDAPAAMGVAQVEPKVHREPTESERFHDETRETLDRLGGLLEEQVDAVRRHDGALEALPAVARGVQELTGRIAPALDQLPALQRRTEQLGAELSAALEPLPEIRDRAESLSERLGGALEPLAAIDRRTEELSRNMTAALDRAEERETVLHESLARLGDTSEEHGTTLGRLREIATGQHETVAQIRQHLAAVSRSVAETGSTLAELSESVETLGTASTQTAEAVRELATEMRSSSMVLAETLKRVEHWVVAALVIAGGASIVALIAAGVALFG